MGTVGHACVDLSLFAVVQVHAKVVMHAASQDTEIPVEAPELGNELIKYGHSGMGHLDIINVPTYGQLVPLNGATRIVGVNPKALPAERPLRASDIRGGRTLVDHRWPSST